MSDWTSSMVAEALDRRYGGASQGRENEKWITLREARSGAGFDGNNGSCDYLAINTWQSQGMQLVGHEIKVSYSDWQNELRKPEKSERFARYCRRWWVVAPVKLAARIRDELPPTWGLLAVSEKQTREVVAAPAREPATVPAWWWVGWLAQLDRRDKRAFTDEVNKQIAVEVERRVEYEARRKDPTVDVTRQDVVDLRNLREWHEKIATTCEAAGISMRDLMNGSTERLRKVAPFLGWNTPDLERLASELRRTADALGPSA